MSGVAPWAAVALLGGLGAAMRFLVGAAVGGRLGTLAVNASGSLALGLLAGSGAGGRALLLAGTALLGSYTTFSAWMLEADELARAGRAPVAARYLALSAVLGLAAAAAGRALAG